MIKFVQTAKFRKRKFNLLFTVPGDLKVCVPTA